MQLPSMQPVPPCHFRHDGTRLHAFADNPRLVIARPSPALTAADVHLVGGVALRIADRPASAAEPPSSVDDRIIAILAASPQPLSFPELRGQCRARSATVYERLAALAAAGRLTKSAQGYRLADSVGPAPGEPLDGVRRL